MKNKLIVALATTLILIGCAGKTPMPVPQYQPYDNDLSCNDILVEISNNQSKIMQLIPQEKKTGKNAALGVAGAFLIVPWFFMDFSDAERIEVQAYQMRNSRLRALYSSKGCEKKQKLPAPIQFKMPEGK